MIERVIGTFDTPWEFVPLDGAYHDPDEKYYPIKVVDAEGHIICETDDREVAEAIVELPNMFYRLQAIAQMQPAILCHIGGEDVECPRCVDLIRGGKEMMHRLGVEYDDKTTY